MLQRIDALLKDGCSFSLETTLATRHYLSLLERAKKLDYRVTLLFSGCRVQIWPFNAFNVA